MQNSSRRHLSIPMTEYYSHIATHFEIPYCHVHHIKIHLIFIAIISLIKQFHFPLKYTGAFTIPVIRTIIHLIIMKWFFGWRFSSSAQLILLNQSSLIRVQILPKPWSRPLGIHNIVINNRYQLVKISFVMSPYITSQIPNNPCCSSSLVNSQLIFVSSAGQ